MTVSASEDLQNTLERAKELAAASNHEHTTLEHLLLALIEDKDAVGMLRGCAVDLEVLKSDLTEFLGNEELVAKDPATTLAVPTKAFENTVERAYIHITSSGREIVTGANVLVAIFSTRDSHAARFLNKQDMTRYDAVNFIAHGISKVPPEAPRPETRTDRHNLQGPWVETFQRWQDIIDSASPDDYIEFAVATSLQDAAANEWLAAAFQVVAPFGRMTADTRKSLDHSVFATLTARHPGVHREISKIQRAILDSEGIIISQNGDETLFALKRNKLDDFKGVLGLTSIQANRVLAPERNGFNTTNLPAIAPR